jgi:deazaflavin-dependent oxidoreductase (nitroreductase family)
MTHPHDPKPPLPRLAFMLPFTTRFFNPISRHIVRWLPGFGLIGYAGRRTGKRYLTPINAFRRGDEWVFALTYGSQVQWVKNVLAAGEADLLKRRRTIHLVDPVLVVDDRRRLMPFGVRQVLGPMRVSEFLRMRPVSERR